MTLLLAIACTTDELSQSYEIDRVRILGVAAEPAEPRPGETVSLTSLVVSPVEPLLGTLYMICDATETTDFGCTFDPALMSDPASMDPDALAEAGVVGFDPYYPPTWTVPEDYLDGLTDAEKQEGVNATVNLVAIPDEEELDEDSDLEIAFKRIPVSEATTPNHNPVVSGLRIAGADVANGATVELDADQTYEIEVVLAEGSVEDYSFVTTDGTTETRTEEPYLLYYLQEGHFDQTSTLYPYTSVQYTTPAEPAFASAGLWFVVRDRRGGMAWSQITVVVRSTES